MEGVYLLGRYNILLSTHLQRRLMPQIRIPARYSAEKLSGVIRWISWSAYGTFSVSYSKFDCRHSFPCLCFCFSLSSAAFLVFHSWWVPLWSYLIFSLIWLYQILYWKLYYIKYFTENTIFCYWNNNFSAYIILKSNISYERKAEMRWHYFRKSEVAITKLFLRLIAS